MFSARTCWSSLTTRRTRTTRPRRHPRPQRRGQSARRPPSPGHTHRRAASVLGSRGRGSFGQRRSGRWRRSGGSSGRCGRWCHSPPGKVSFDARDVLVGGTVPRIPLPLLSGRCNEGGSGRGMCRGRHRPDGAGRAVLRADQGGCNKPPRHRVLRALTAPIARCGSARCSRASASWGRRRRARRTRATTRWPSGRRLGRALLPPHRGFHRPLPVYTRVRLEFSATFPASLAGKSQ